MCIRDRNIVDEECVGLAVLFAETHGGTGADGLDQFVCKLVALDAVSYTHLDVYKRQAEPVAGLRVVLYG